MSGRDDPRAEDVREVGAQPPGAESAGAKPYRGKSMGKQPAARSAGRQPAGAQPAGAKPDRGKPAFRRPDPARQVAYDVLAAVRTRQSYANLVMPALLRERRIDTRDGAFATELAYGALRGQGLYDAVLQACVDRPLSDVDPPVLDVLRLGAHQLLRMRTPPHAAVSSTVDLARRVGSAGPAAFVNAVLRKVSAHDVAGWLEIIGPADDLARTALETSHPQWIASAFRDALGGDLAETRAALLADDARPGVHLVARRMSRDELLADSGGEVGLWSRLAVRMTQGGDPGALGAVRDGSAGVQDEGSQLMALALAAAPIEGRDDMWVDMCAGPGGKAAILQVIADGRGARLVAVDSQHHRSRLVRQSGVREVVTADARAVPLAAGSADRVLLDAPCSGLGALRRRPDARWRRTPQDLPGLTRLQGELLDAAVRLLRPGGVLAYVTCSPHLAETVVPVHDVLRRHPQLTRLDARPLLPDMPLLGDGPTVQLWPHRHGTDAMHLALLRA